MRWLLLASAVFVIGCGPSTLPEEEATILAKEALELADRGKTTEALEKYREALEIVPGWTKVRFDYGRLAFEKGQTHFMNHLQLMEDAKAASEAGKPEDAEALIETAQDERSIGLPLLQIAEDELRRVVKSRTNRDHEFNGYLMLAHTYALREQWVEAKRHYERALEMGPQAEPRMKIEKALELVEAEIDKETQEKIGARPE